ncbi:MAG: sugar-binding protein [Gracilimonas sp.]
MKYILSLALLILIYGCSNTADSKIDYIAHKSNSEIQIDGIAAEEAWEQAEWREISERWLGQPYTKDDFTGRFKLSWDDNHLYVLAEITDDSLYHVYDGTDRYWDNDILEIFIDEDASGGNHQYNHNAFAYHIDKNYDVFDIDTDSSAYYFNDHVNTQRSKSGNTYTWEVAIKIYDDSFNRNVENYPVDLFAGKEMGFAISYCDNDTSEFRENFIGSVEVKGEDKNRGWIDAGTFGRLVLQE